jgi:hypothetical protein
VTFLTFVPLLPVQRTISEVNASCGLPPEPWSKLSLLNWLAVAIGGVLLVLIAFGMVLELVWD